MGWIRERVKTLWDWNSILLKDLLNFQDHLRIYMNKRNNVEKSSTPLGIIQRISAIEKLT
jgi:hypothetical protein